MGDLKTHLDDSYTNTNAALNSEEQVDEWKCNPKAILDVIINCIESDYINFQYLIGRYSMAV